MKKLFVILFLFVVFDHHAKTQQDEWGIEGTVTDNKGVALPGVSIHLGGTEYGSLTNADGYFRITGVGAGTYTLRASFVGFETYSQPVKVKDGMRAIIIQLKEHLHDLPEVVIAR